MAHHDRAYRIQPPTMPLEFCFPMVLRAAIDLRVFEIIAQGGPEAQLSPSEMVAKMPTTNPNAAATLERILRNLGSNTYLTVQKDGEAQYVYGLTPQSRWLVPNEDGVSLAPLFQFMLQKSTVETYYHLEDTVLEGGNTPFERAHGMELFEYAAIDCKFGGLFHEAMSTAAALVLDEVFQVNKGLMM